jgi:hypothetical protein
LASDSKDGIKLALGLVSTMAALVLGLLVSSAKSSYDAERGEVIQMAAKVAFLDRILTRYGSEAAGARSALRSGVADAIRRMWPTEREESAHLAPNEEAADAFYVAIQCLSLGTTCNARLRRRRQLLWSTSVSFGRCS